MAYWQDRMAKAQDAISAKKAKDIEKQLRKYYAAAMDKVISSFEHTYLKILKDKENRGEITPADLYKLDQYWTMQGQLKNELQKLGDKQVKLLSKAFEENFLDVYESIALQSTNSFATISTEAVTQMVNQIWAVDGKSWSQRIWTNTELLAQTLNDELVNCVATGAKSSYLKEVLQERFSVSFGRADALVRTELAHIQTQAAQKRYQDAGIKEVQLWADPDERRCPKCAALHKKIYPVNGAMPVPVHPRCRCVMLPVIE